MADENRKREMTINKILITGANKGIGLATAAAILEQQEDASIVMGVRDLERGRRARADLCAKNPHWAARLELLEIDVADADSVSAARDMLLERYRGDPAPLYGLVNNAGIGLNSAAMTAVIEVNTLGTKWVCDAFLPLLGDGGRVVNVSSASAPKFVSQCSAARQAFFQDVALDWAVVEGLISEVIELQGNSEGFAALGLGEINAYGFSKACTSLYTLLLAREHPRLRINACTPGYIETDLTRPLAEQRGLAPADLGMKQPEQGTVAILHLLFGEPLGTGQFYGSDAKRSPLDRYRSPGSPEYTGTP